MVDEVYAMPMEYSSGLVVAILEGKKKEKKKQRWW
jgi:hypothetical protein